MLGPGTADTRLIAAGRRALASNGANLVLRNGVVAGTRRVRGRDAEVSWFAESGPVPETALHEAVRHLGSIRRQTLSLLLWGS